MEFPQQLPIIGPDEVRLSRAYLEGLLDENVLILSEVQKDHLRTYLQNPQRLFTQTERKSLLEVFEYLFHFLLAHEEEEIWGSTQDLLETINFCKLNRTYDLNEEEWKVVNLYQRVLKGKVPYMTQEEWHDFLVILWNIGHELTPREYQRIFAKVRPAP